MKRYDVVVAGAGVAGAAAAVAAARRGMRAALLEKTLLTGGLAAAGNINIYLPLCDGNGTQVSFGITEEMLRKSIQYGPGNPPAGWGGMPGERSGRYMVSFAPASFTLALDEMLEDAGVELWLDTVVTGVRRDGRRVVSAEVFNKSGRVEIGAGSFIDATGDADLAVAAQVPWHPGGNAMACWIFEYCKGKGELVEHCRTAPRGFADDPESYHAGLFEDADEFDGINGRMVSEFVMGGRRSYRREFAAGLAAGTWKRDERFPLCLPTVPDLRHTRAIDGRVALAPGMDWRRCDDSVGLIADWRKAGSVWEVPYGTLLAGGVDNLLAVGRCAAAVGDAWEVLRVIPAAALI